jgi:HK97 family phage major capsid protein
MLSIQEMVEKTSEQRKQLEQFMDSKGYFDPSERSVFHGLKRSVSRELYETMQRVSLTEFLGKSGTTDVAGAAYLIPDVVSAKLYSSLQTRDIVPLISADVVTPKSDTCKVQVGLTGAKTVGSAGGAGKDTADVKQATIKLVKLKADFNITNELMEDQEYGLIEWHINEASKALAAKAAGLALTVLKTATDGRGTTVAVAAGADTTTPAQVGSAIAVVGSGAQSADFPGFVADTMVSTSETWGDAISITAGHNAYPAQTAGFNAWFAGLDVIFCNDPALYATFSSNRMTNCVTPIFSRGYALLTARKSFPRIEKYSKPVDDLVGACVTGRQDSVTMNDDAIVALTES